MDTQARPRPQAFPCFSTLHAKNRAREAVANAGFLEGGGGGGPVLL